MSRYPMYRFYRKGQTFTELWGSDEAVLTQAADFDKIERIDEIVRETVTTIYEKPKPYFLVLSTDKDGRVHQYSDNRFASREEAQRRIDGYKAVEWREPFHILEVQPS